MKKISVIALSAVLMIGTLGSCKKKYSCTCKGIGAGYESESTSTSTDTQKNAEADCKANEGTKDVGGVSVTTSCTLKEA